MTVFPEIFEEDCEQLFHDANLIAKWTPHCAAVVYYTMKQVFLDQAQAALLRQIIGKKMHQYLKARNVVEARGETILCSDDYLVLNFLLLEMNDMNAIVD